MRIAFYDQLGTDVEDAGGYELADELHHLARGVAEAQDPEARGDVAGELLFPPALHLRFDRHGLERFDSGDALDQKGLVLGAAPELFVQAPPEQRRRSRRDRDVEGERAEHDPGQHGGVDVHDRQEHDGEEQVDDEGERRAGEEVADVLQFAYPRYGIADSPRLKIGHRQGHQVAEQARTQLDVDAVGGVREQIGALDAEDGLEQRDRHQTHHQHLQRRQAAVHQHLVDDHLEEQRRDQREELQEERGDEHLAEEASIFVDRPEKPGDAESAVRRRTSRPGGSSGSARRPRPTGARPAPSRPAGPPVAVPGPCPRSPWPAAGTRRRASSLSPAGASWQAATTGFGRLAP